MGERTKAVLLLHPPYGDFTYPYHALSYASAPLKAAGYDVQVLDLNALWFRGVFTRAWVSRRREGFALELDAVDDRESLDISDQRRVAELIRCLAICDDLDPEAAVEVFRTARFYDFEVYLRARQQVRAFEILLSEFYAPYDFATAFEVPVYVPNAARLVADALSCRPLIDDIAELLRRHCRRDDYVFCGVGVPFTMNLMPAMAVLAAVEEVFPGSKRVSGGTAISDIEKYKVSHEALAPLARVSDHLFVGEAEPGIARYAQWCLDGCEGAPPPQVVLPGRTNPHQARGKPAYVSLSDRPGGGDFVPYDWKAAPPDYSWIDWELYLAPEPQVNYSPTRGCFWNKCTFCDYGLNDDVPTAPSRGMDVDTAVRHLKALSERGIRCVYFAVDAIAPNFLRALADQLVSEGLRPNWSGEFFLSRAFTGEFVAGLARSGLTTASFGLESGSDAVLERMGKGRGRVGRDLIPALDAFRQSPIGLQPKFFFGFPGETDADRQATFDLLTEYRSVFSIVTRGNVFDLSLGSDVAKNPARYGIARVVRKPGDDIGGGLDYELADGRRSPTLLSFGEFNRRLNYPRYFERPWAGGIDTLHTKLYIERFGRDVFHRLGERYLGPTGCPGPGPRVRVVSRFDVHELMQNVRTFEVASCPVRSSAARAMLGGQFDEALAEVCAPLERREPPRAYDVQFTSDGSLPEETS
jgi:anaerobic magnesium-protoporphyrin IX monomethyl ester cyclase